MCASGVAQGRLTPRQVTDSRTRVTVLVSPPEQAQSRPWLSKQLLSQLEHRLHLSLLHGASLSKPQPTSVSQKQLQQRADLRRASSLPSEAAPAVHQVHIACQAVAHACCLHHGLSLPKVEGMLRAQHPLVLWRLCCRAQDHAAKGPHAHHLGTAAHVQAGARFKSSASPKGAPQIL